MIPLHDIPDDENGDVLRGMRANGDSLTLPRTIDFSVVFPSEDTVRVFCETVDDGVLELCYEKNELHEDCPWDVTARKDMAPDHAAISAFEEQLAACARPLGGRNDGWGASIWMTCQGPDRSSLRILIRPACLKLGHGIFVTAL